MTRALRSPHDLVFPVAELPEDASIEGVRVSIDAEGAIQRAD